MPPSLEHPLLAPRHPRGILHRTVSGVKPTFDHNHGPSGGRSTERSKRALIHERIQKLDVQWLISQVSTSASMGAVRRWAHG